MESIATNRCISSLTFSFLIPLPVSKTVQFSNGLCDKIAIFYQQECFYFLTSINHHGPLLLKIYIHLSLKPLKINLSRIFKFWKSWHESLCTNFFSKSKQTIHDIKILSWITFLQVARQCLYINHGHGWWSKVESSHQRVKIHFLVFIPLNTSLEYKGLINPS